MSGVLAALFTNASRLFTLVAAATAARETRLRRHACVDATASLARDSQASITACGTAVLELFAGGRTAPSRPERRDRGQRVALRVNHGFMALAGVRTGLVTVTAFTFAVSSCLRLNDQRPERDANVHTPVEARQDTAPSGSGGPISVGQDAPMQPPEAGAPSGNVSCPPDQHVCGGVCVDNRSIDTCGVSCAPCPAVVDGTPTCDGMSCGIKCPAGKRECDGRCSDNAEPCNAGCPKGKRLCNDRCVDLTDVQACGSSCMACPAPSGGTAMCDGRTCISRCPAGWLLCGARCANPMTDKNHCGQCQHACLNGCTSGSCDCLTQSSSNLVRNAGFTSDVSGWTLEGSLTAKWTPEDAASCASSGAMIVRTTALPSNQSESLTQCLPVTRATNYNYGVWRKESAAPGDQYFGFISLFWYSDAGCSPNAQVGDENSPGPSSSKGEWTLHSGRAQPPANAVAVQFTLGIVGTHEVRFDMPYMTPVPGEF